jgi:hypothetical protein
MLVSVRSYITIDPLILKILYIRFTEIARIRAELLRLVAFGVFLDRLNHRLNLLPVVALLGHICSNYYLTSLIYGHLAIITLHKRFGGCVGHYP